MIAEGMVFMRSSRFLVWERRCGQGPGMGMQKVVWINATGVMSSLVMEGKLMVKKSRSQARC